MENSSLHKAHEAGRQAVKLQRKGLFEKAAECHLTAANFLYELQQKVPKNSSVICSLEEQSKYHKRQAELAHIVRNISDKQKSKKVMMADKTNFRTPQNYQMNRVLSAIAHHEVQILKNFDEADSLLQILSNNKGQTSTMTEKSPTVQKKPMGFTIRPRKDAEVIEELQTVNLNLRTLVDTLMIQLQECREENKVLRTKLETYEPVKKKSDTLHTVPTSSVSASTAVASSIHMTSYRLPVRKLPELAPLEEPVFDFSAYDL